MAKIADKVSNTGILLKNANADEKTTLTVLLTNLIHYCNDKNIDFTTSYQAACKQVIADRAAERAQ